MQVQTNNTEIVYFNNNFSFSGSMSSYLYIKTIGKDMKI